MSTVASAAEKVIEKVVRDFGNVARIDVVVIALRKAGFTTADKTSIELFLDSLNFGMSEGYVYAKTR